MGIVLPDEFKTRMREYLGADFDAFIASYESPNVKGLRFNHDAIGEGTSPIAYFDKLKHIPWEENGYFYVSEEISPGKHPYHEAGMYYIQEPSAMAPVHYLDIKPCERVLDMCASPGGKSTQIASKMHGKGILISNEINNKRANVLSENIERMGIKNAVVTNEPPEKISKWLPDFFDKVLVDAPCSGEGMFKKTEAAVSEWSTDNVIMCAKRQALILDEAAKTVKDGGTLVYSTCTFSREENEENIKDFLLRHSDFYLDEMPLFEGFERGFDNIGVRLYPHKVCGEGHFVCRLKKQSNNVSLHNFGGDNMDFGLHNLSHISYNPDRRFNSELSKSQLKNLKEMFDFTDSYITGGIKEELHSKKLTMFGDNIYMLPDECPALSGIKVLRAGLHIGTLKKNRFEPAHALAKALFALDVTECINVSFMADNTVIYKYIAGETFNYEPDSPDKKLPSGWILICVDGFSLGFGKITGSTVKNHYPKGLRKQIFS